MRQMTKEDNARLQNMSIEELEEVIQISSEWANRAGEIQVKKSINLLEFTPLTDWEGERHSWGMVLDNPKGVKIFIKDFPPRLKQYSKTRFSEKLGYGDVRETWRWLMRHGVHDIRQAGYKMNQNRKIVIYKFHFRYITDPDNMNIMFLNDLLQDWDIIAGDNVNQLVTIITGVVDPDNPGTEIRIYDENVLLA